MKLDLDLSVREYGCLCASLKAYQEHLRQAGLWYESARDLDREVELLLKKIIDKHGEPEYETSSDADDSGSN